jgi:hypothetical protein
MNTPRRTNSTVEALSPIWQKSVQNALAKTPRRLHRNGSPLERVAHSPLRKTNISPLHKTSSPTHKLSLSLKSYPTDSKEKTRTTQVLSPLSQKQVDKRSNTPTKSKLLKEAIGPIAVDSPCNKKPEPKKVFKKVNL